MIFKNKKGQVTLFIILAILLVAGIIIYFTVDFDTGSSVSEEFRPAYDHYLSCIEDLTRQGINLLGEQGGYIETPDFEPGSSYMPFSSHLDFLGQGVPYWMYVSGNNLLRENVPTKAGMQRQLSEYVSERIGTCDFSDFELSGFDVYVDEGSSEVKINELDVELNLNNRVTMFRGEQSVTVNNHNLKLNSKLGKFYDTAIEVYNFEKTNLFLENYALDVMRLYAPVTGTDISCTPKVFVDSEIQKGIVEGLVSNIPSIKLGGDYYGLANKERSYFVEDGGLNIDENLNFFYSPDWPTRIEIYGDRVVEPVGLQEGLGILGFCYVPYHLVYDINFPVMVQLYDDEELFQFPVGVVISKNQPRKSLPSLEGTSIESEVCEFKNKDVDVFTYDLSLNPVESDVKFKCLDSICQIGSTEFNGGDAVLEGRVPQCVNGFLVANAEGYAEGKVQISTNSETTANIVLRKKYELSLDLGNVDTAMVRFDSRGHSKTILYPEINTVELVEEEYNVTVYAYQDSTLKIPAVNQQNCVDVPESGLGGFLGLETEKCFDINIPETDVSFAVVGGGNTNWYVTEGELENSNEININVPLFGPPTSLDDVQKNHLLVDDSRIFMELE